MPTFTAAKNVTPTPTHLNSVGKRVWKPYEGRTKIRKAHATPQRFEIVSHFCIFRSPFVRFSNSFSNRIQMCGVGVTFFAAVKVGIFTFWNNVCNIQFYFIKYNAKWSRWLLIVVFNRYRSSMFAFWVKKKLFIIIILFWVNRCVIVY